MPVFLPSMLVLPFSKGEKPGSHAPLCLFDQIPQVSTFVAFVPRTTWPWLGPGPALLTPPCFSLPAMCRGLPSPWGPTACAGRPTAAHRLLCLEPWPLLQGGCSLLRLTPWSGQPLYTPSLLSPTSHFLTKCFGTNILKRHSHSCVEGNREGGGSAEGRARWDAPSR